MADTLRPAPTTTNAGIPVESDEHSLTIGQRNVDKDLGDRVEKGVRAR